MRMSETSQPSNTEHKFAVGPGGHRIDASRNFWDGSGLKIDCASTDVAWGHGGESTAEELHSRFDTRRPVFNNKILTSARNGELIMWDLNKSGSTKYGKLLAACFNKWLNTTKSEERRIIFGQFTRCLSRRAYYITASLVQPMVTYAFGYDF